MTLRNKTILAIVATLLGLCVALYIAASTLLLDSVERAEEEQTRKVVRGLLTFVAQSGRQLEERFSDWSAWDDAYEFVEDKNDHFKQANLVDATLANLKLNVIVFVNTKGEITYGTGFDLINHQRTPLPEGLAERLVPGSSLLSPGTGHPNITGPILLPKHPMLVTAQAILTSEGKGPPRGTLLIGRWMDDAAQERLTALVGLPISIFRLDQGNIPPDVNNAVAAISDVSPILATPLSETEMGGYTITNDIDGRPAFVTRVTVPRISHQQGIATVRLLLWFAIACGVVFGAVMLIFIERLVLARVLRLSREINAIGEKHAVTSRVTAEGADELAKLGRSINETLRKVEEHEANQSRRSTELVVAKDLAESANRLRNAFLANMSHELRTPLNAIIGYSEILEEDAVREGKTSLATDLLRIKSSGEQLLSLIDEILDVSTIEAQKLALNPTTFEVRDVLSAAIASLKPLAEQNGNTLHIEGAEGAGKIHADAIRVRQVLLNIIGNALKFTKDGDVRITVDRVSTVPSSEKEAASLGILRFRVTDTGIGIDETAQEKLFQPFTQIDPSTTRKFGGAGLGLSLSRSLCHLMGGDITVESELGRGSTFTITLPIQFGE